MITPSYGLTATERVLPKLALDFTTASLDSRVTFTRTGNTATVVNSSGFITPINADLPRFDHDPVTLVCNGLLIEESRNNFMLRSQEFDNTTSWGKTRSTVTPDATNSPDNTQNSDALLQAAGQTTFGNIAQTVTVSTTATTLSVFAKPNGKNFLILQETLTDGTAKRTWFNLQNGTIGSKDASHTASIKLYANGFYRCSITFTPNAIRSNNATVGLADSDGSITVVDNQLGLYVWGAQLEAGAFPTSYIPTTTTSVTRNTDVATMTGTNFSDWYNASEGSFAVSAVLNGSSVNRDLMTISDGTTNNTMQLRWASGSQAQFAVAVSGVNQVSIAPSGYSTLNTIYQRVIGYKLDNFAQGINGVLVGTDTLGSVPTVNKLNLGSTAVNGVSLSGHIQKVYYWPQRLINAEIQAFSK